MPQLRRKNRRFAFTMIELLIVIGVIGLLAGMLLLGLRSVLGSSKASSTRVTLQGLQGMLAELDAKTRLSKPPQQWRWYDTGSTSIVAPISQSTSQDFWHDPFTGASTTYRNPHDALDAPLLVDANQLAARNGSRQVLNTQIVMHMLLGLPTNRTVLDKTSPDRYFIPQWQNTNAKVYAAGNDGVLYTSDDPVDPTTSAPPTDSVNYVEGAQVLYQGVRYAWNNLTPGNATPPGGSWTTDISPPAPIFLDAWSNPIIFVPGSGLRVRLLNGKSANDKTDNTQTFIVISPEGKTGIDAGTKNPIVLQPGRPFFASAGPDGNFATGDDNIYSFEQ